MTSPAGLVDGLLADRYRITDRLAAGGMGEVWRAQDLVLDRPVAVKTLRAEYLDDEDFRARFRAEARHAARLSHPGIASVYDFGELPDRAWLVMELVDGEPLSGLLRREHALSPDRALDVVAQTAAALQAAHSGGVVHRDVKPGNLLVRPDGAVKVTDFGIASATDGTALTRTGQVVGTAHYLSPEQAAGRAGTPSSDLYALGVVAYECLAGVRPFPGQSPVAVALGHLNDPPPPLPATVPAPVRALVERLMSKDAADRPASAADVAREAQELRAQLSGGGLATLPVEPPAAARPEGAEQQTRALPVAGAAGAAAALPPPPAAGPSSGPASRRGQRRAVSATMLLLLALALLLGVRSAASDASTTTVPRIAAGTPAAQAVSALDGAQLEVRREEQASASVPEGAVVGVRPAPGTEVDEGSEVVLLVSSGPAPVQVDAQAVVGRPAAEVRAALAARGLKPVLASDGRGTAVGTVSAVEPTGTLEAGSVVLLHGVPPPAPAPVAPRDDDEKDDKDEDGGKGDKGSKGKDG